MRLKPGSDDGAIAILVAILSVVLFGFAAIVVDLGYARTVEGDAQNAVDASALAGAGILSTDGTAAALDKATRAIEKFAHDNVDTSDSDWAACTASKPSAGWVQGDPRTNCILFNHAVNPTKVQVVLPPKHVDSFFGGLVGYGGIDIGARAQATIRQDDVPGCAVCVQHAFEASSPLEIDAVSPGGPVGSFSASTGLLHAGGSITVEDPGAITFENTPTPAGGASYSSRPIIRPVTDPFAGATMPVGPSSFSPFPDPAPTRTVVCRDGDVLPEAVYFNIRVVASVDDPCTSTGVIVVTGRLEVRPDSMLAATGSVIQLSCGGRTAPNPCGPGAPSAGGRLQVDLGGQLQMFASPNAFSIVADPDNNSRMTINGDLSVDQAIYALSGAVTLGDDVSLTASGQVSVDQLTIGSSSSLTVTAAGAEPLPGPPMVGLYR